MPRRQRRPPLTEPIENLDGATIESEILAAQSRLSKLLKLKEMLESRPEPAQPAGLSLYPWQRDALEAWTGRGQRGVVQAVTGAGKTRVGVAAIAEAVDSGVPAVVLVPTLVLQKQWVKNLGELLPDVAVSSRASDGRSWQVLVTTVQSAMMRAVLTRSTPGLLVADECHRYGAESFARALGEEYRWRLGLTATLERGDAGDRILEEYFGGVCFDLGYERALREELIAPYRFALVSVPLTADERSTYDELDEVLRDARSGLVLKYDVPEEPIAEFLAAVSRLAEERAAAGSGLARFYLAKFAARKALLAETQMKRLALAGLSSAVQASNGTIVFTQTQNASTEVAQTLMATGCSAVAIHSDLDSEEREQRLELFRAGDTTAISAPRILDEGVDVPECDLGIVMASNRSRRQMIQRLGRVLRRRPGKTARFVVLYAENSIEDPFAAGHLPDFYDHCIPWAEREGRFDLNRSELPELLRFLGVEDPAAGVDEQEEIRKAATSDCEPEPRLIAELHPSTLSSGEVRRQAQPDEDREEGGGPPEVLAGTPGVTADPVKDYLKAIGRHPLLSATEEVRLSKQIECGLYADHLLQTGSREQLPWELQQLAAEGKRAFEQLVCSNLRLVVSLAKRYTGRGLEFLDLIQEGNLGLIHAAEMFDYRLGNKFSTYATWWIKQAITRALADQSRTIRLPVHLVEKLQRVHRQLTANGLSWDEFSRLHPEGLAEDDVSASDLAYGARLWGPLASIDALVEALDDSFEMTGLIGSVPSCEDERLDEIETSRLVQSVEDLLNLKDRRLPLLLACRYGFQSGEPETLEVIGALLGVTRERVRQMEKHALELIRCEAEAGRLTSAATRSAPPDELSVMRAAFADVGRPRSRPARRTDGGKRAPGVVVKKARLSPKNSSDTRVPRAGRTGPRPAQKASKPSKEPSSRPPSGSRVSRSARVVKALPARPQTRGRKEQPRRISGGIELRAGDARAVFDPAMPERPRVLFASPLPPPDDREAEGNGERVRQELAASGATLQIGERLVLSRNCDFDNWRDATDAVMEVDGVSIDAWRDKDGKTLSQILLQP
jgi:RNA polymerase primary sigma factor